MTGAPPAPGFAPHNPQNAPTTGAPQHIGGPTGAAGAAGAPPPGCRPHFPQNLPAHGIPQHMTGPAAAAAAAATGSPTGGRGAPQHTQNLPSFAICPVGQAGHFMAMVSLGSGRFKPQIPQKSASSAIWLPQLHFIAGLGSGRGFPHLPQNMAAPTNGVLHPAILHVTTLAAGTVGLELGTPVALGMGRIPAGVIGVAGGFFMAGLVLQAIM